MKQYCILGRGCICREGNSPAELAASSHTKPSPNGTLEFRSMIESGWTRRLDPISLMACAAIRAALSEAGNPHMKSPDRTGTVLGSRTAGLGMSIDYTTQLRELGSDLASPMLFTNTVLNAPASHASILLGITGASFSCFGHETASSDAIWAAMRMLDFGRMDLVIAGGVDGAHLRLPRRLSQNGAGVVILAPEDLCANQPHVRGRISGIESERSEWKRLPETVPGWIGRIWREFSPHTVFSGRVLISIPDNGDGMGERIRSALADDPVMGSGSSECRAGCSDRGSFGGVMDLIYATECLRGTGSDGAPVPVAILTDIASDGSCNTMILTS